MGKRIGRQTKGRYPHGATEDAPAALVCTACGKTVPVGKARPELCPHCGGKLKQVQTQR